MTRSLILLLVMCGTSYASNAANRPPCDGEMTTPALKFVRLIPSALDSRAITAEDLLWMIGQPRPANPMRASRRPETFSQKNGFQREIPRITPAQWKLVVVQAQQILSQKLHQEHLVQNAKAATAFVAAPVPESNFSWDHFALDTFVNSKHELFILAKDWQNERSFVHNRSTGKTITIDRANLSLHAYDIFETAQGDVLIAFNTSTHLEVFNANTGLAVSNPVKLTSEMRSYKPLLYEESGVPMAVILATMQPNRLGDEIRLKVNLKTGEVTQGVDLPNNRARAVRLADNHLYLVGVERDQKTNKNSALLYDLTLNKDLLRLTDVSSVFLGKRTTAIPGLFGEPVLALKSPERNTAWLAVNPRTSHPEELPRSIDVDPESFLDHQGRTLRLSLESTKHGGKLVMHDLITGSQTYLPGDYQAEAQFPLSTLHQTNLGTVLTIWETFNDGSNQIHLIFVDHGHHYSFGLKVREVRKFFYTPADERILILCTDQNDIPQILQIWGPEVGQK